MQKTKLQKVREGLDIQYEILTEAQESIADVITWFDAKDFMMLAADLSSIRIDIQEVKSRIEDITYLIDTANVYAPEIGEEDARDWMDQDTH